ncbi:hypothetical protein [Olsenella sp. oral taxon 809]|uniref:hypothetical protein n=1 Tax=Olsenella sp. oral taxon 809 TaxID=661086 RepID=UPI001E5BB1F5|nr:hypothetical protein [Olsenella sp. oral taxon 809]
MLIKPAHASTSLSLHMVKVKKDNGMLINPLPPYALSHLAKKYLVRRTPALCLSVKETMLMRTTVSQQVFMAKKSLAINPPAPMPLPFAAIGEEGHADHPVSQVAVAEEGIRPSQTIAARIIAEEKDAEGEAMEHTEEELVEARRQIAPTVHKLQASLETMQAKPNADKLKPQITLTQRRIKAFQIANDLIEQELAKKD